MSAFPSRHAVRALALLATASALTLPVLAQQHAHTHGRLSMDVAVDAQTLTLTIESPLDGFLGFERAPRTDAERKRVSDMVARLNAADQLFQPDPAAACTLSTVTLNSAVLGLGDAKKAGDHGHDDQKGHAHAEDEHADIDIDIVFHCAQAAQARHVDVKLFEAFPRIRTIEAQVATPRGQFKRTLRPNTPRLQLGR
jgi:hypothetical protein